MFEDLTYEDAYFYKILIELGIKDEINNYIEYIENELTEYNDIYLELISNQSSTSNIISALNKFIDKKEIDLKFVYKKVRNVILDKLNNNVNDINITIKMLNDLYTYYFIDDTSYEWICFYEDYVEGNLRNKNIEEIIKNFLKNGELEYKIDYYSINKKDKKNKFKIRILLFLLSILIIAINIFILIVSNIINKDIFEFVLVFSSIIILTFLTTTWTIYILDYSFIYDVLTRLKRKKD